MNIVRLLLVCLACLTGLFGLACSKQACPGTVEVPDSMDSFRDLPEGFRVCEVSANYGTLGIEADLPHQEALGALGIHLLEQGWNPVGSYTLESEYSRAQFRRDERRISISVDGETESWLVVSPE